MMTETGQQIAPGLPLQDYIEILPVTLLDQNRGTVSALQTLAKSLHLEFGWHYLLDLTWILRNLELANLKQAPGPGQAAAEYRRTDSQDFHGLRIMDAGAGTGILQWYLAQQGAEVFSVDRMSRAALPLRFRRRFAVQGLRPGDLDSAGQAFMQGFKREVSGPFYRRWAARLLGQGRDLLCYFRRPSVYEARPDVSEARAGGEDHSGGRVWIYNQDLSRLQDIADNSLDAVVSVSALEHNTPEGLQRVNKEIMRVLKPGGLLLATLTAGRDQDWWHEASSGWCYTGTSLQRLFDLAPGAPSNYNRYDELFEALRGCAELRDNLASFYYQSSCKGMPGGVWDPQYQPVGVCKVKGQA
jgi:SAM-dependent methyltransferase